MFATAKTGFRDSRAAGPREDWAAIRIRSIVIQDRTGAAILGEERIAAVAEQVKVERLVGLLLAVTVDDDRDGPRRLAGCEGQRAGFGDVVLVAGLRGAVRRLERHRHRMIVGGRKRDGEREQGCLALLAPLLAHVADADARLVVHDGADTL